MKTCQTIFNTHTKSAHQSTNLRSPRRRALISFFCPVFRRTFEQMYGNLNCPFVCHVMSCVMCHVAEYIVFVCIFQMICTKCVIESMFHHYDNRRSIYFHLSFLFVCCSILLSNSHRLLINTYFTRHFLNKNDTFLITSTPQKKQPMNSTKSTENPNRSNNNNITKSITLTPPNRISVATTT